MRHQFKTNLFASCIKAKRADKSLRDLVDEIDGAVSTSTLSRLERGEEPDLKTFMVVCDWLQINASQFLVCDSDGNDASGMADLAVYSHLMKIQRDVNFLVKIFQPSGEDG